MTKTKEKVLYLCLIFLILIYTSQKIAITPHNNSEDDLYGIWRWRYDSLNQEKINCENIQNFGTKLSNYYYQTDTSASLSSLEDLMELIQSNIIQTTESLKIFLDNHLINSILTIPLILVGTIILDRIKYREASKDLSANQIIIKMIITDNPGITLREIHRKAGLALGLTQYHIRILENIQEIDSLKLGRCKHFFSVNEGITFNEKILHSLAQNPKLKMILLCMNEFETIKSQKCLVDLSGESKALISYYFKILRKFNILEDNKHEIKISQEFKVAATKINKEWNIKSVPL